MTEALIVNQIQSQMELACEAVNAKQYIAAQAAFLECVNLVQMLQMEKQAARLAKLAEPKQITLDIETEK